MKGIIIKYTHLRSRPSVNAPILAYLDIHETVLIQDIVLGDEVDENDEWYMLENQGFVCSEAVKPDSLLDLKDREDFTQYLISYRKTNPYGKPKTDSTDIPDSLSFQRLVLPALYENLNLHDDVDFFVGNIINDLQNLQNAGKQHVILYVPGYQPLPNLSFELWENFVQNYMEHPGQSVAKVIFFTWPSHQLGRKTIDDRALRAGQLFGANRLYEVIRKLSEQLADIGKTLNLVVHSFGHQLLNGFLNSGVTFNSSSRVFHRIFLMAPDIVEGSMASPNGVDLTNYYGANEKSHYNLSGINKIAGETHVFWDKYDYLLHVSTRKFAQKILGTPEEEKEIPNYRNLGNYGPKYTGSPGIYYHNLQALLATSSDQGRFKNLYDRPKWRKRMDRLMEGKASYLDVGDTLTLVLNNRKFARHHRYLFTSKAVIEKVIGILNNPVLSPPAPPV